MSKQQMTDDAELQHLLDMVRKLGNQVDFFTQTGRPHTANLLNDARAEIIRLGGLKQYLPASINDLNDTEKSEYNTWLDGAMPNLEPVITWLTNGHDPKEAAKELQIYQANRQGQINE